jgi:endonuclease III
VRHRSTRVLPFSKVVDKLQRHYGPPAPPASTDPLELIIWENIAYLASDERRAEAFATLKQTIGTRLERILAFFACGNGFLRAARKSCRTLHTRFSQLVRSFSALPSGRMPAFPMAAKAECGAAVMALDSNGLRVLYRVGFAEEQKNYSATYRLVQDAIHEQLPGDCDSLIRAYQLLRQHGQELCKRSKPRCAECPLRNVCAYCRTTAAAT